jgi:hypothetical protein
MEYPSGATGEVIIRVGTEFGDMATDSVSDRVRELAEHLGIDESEVLQRAITTGVETLHRDMIVSRYLDGDLTREEAIEELGADVVTQVESARKAIEEDVEWGLHA